ncbi:nitrogenase iron protein NifH [Paramaledivibacter caminithermalis]|uniref:nitrogenase n=1 Tax=Paramaledivibacter caminithermalis (strain DSM 15212 / CIP 107654 / DViRD3) TaxID=1121301 RepID=A0A1M6P2R5_PARC5|nr:nitrogenase iron protein NifH [Paramaledivibacter caminithermalis]SHK02183.1 Mo-nitrogenase iron protein subunit NifH [Paramaledivibacter caminithermalis DSM 15212]
MRKIAVYGKGGIGKSTITSSLSAAISKLGYKVVQIGCDPKADSTINLTNGQKVTPVIQYLKEKGSCESLDEIAVKGYNDIVCIEAGGPTPGVGCAGRGIIMAFETLEDLDAFEEFKPDFVFYDVLGDVVCGGFAMPIRDGYADEVIIVTSGEKMALFAAGNIKMAIDSFGDKGYGRLRGVILNKRNIENEEEIVSRYVKDMDSEIIGIIPRDGNIQKYEEQNMTVIQGDIELPISKTIMDIAKSIVEGSEIQ